MPRLTKNEQDLRKIIQDNLNKFGFEITQLVAKNYLRENTGRLKKSMNFRVKPYNLLIFSQQIYAKWNTYKDRPSRSANAEDYNPLLQEIVKAKSDLTNIIVKELKESIIYPFKNGNNTNRNK